MNRPFINVSLCCLFALSAPLTSYAAPLSLHSGGYIRNFFIISDYSNSTNAELQSRFRLRLEYVQSDSLSAEIAYELAPSIGNHDSSPSPNFPSSLLSYRAFDLDELVYPSNEEHESDFVLHQNLDRAFITFSADQFDLYIGRQPIAFGSARVINPTDIIAPYTYTTIAKEERFGVDALRIKAPTEELGELDFGYVFGDDFKYEESAAFIRLKSYVLMTDIAFMAMVFRENYLLGLNLARSIGGAGTWLETAYVLSDQDSEENYIRASVGSDYSFTDKLYAYIEYHYNGPGKNKAENYLDTVSETAYTDGAVYLLAQHYLAPGVTYQVTSLLILNCQALINVNDGSLILSPVFEYSFADDVYSQIGSYVSIGEGSSDPVTPKSEFGLYPDTAFISINIYF